MMNINTKRYIEKYIKIRDKAGKIIDLKINQGQQKLYDAIKKQNEEGKPIRIIVLKARQIGFSTLTESIIFKNTATKFNVNAGIITHKEEATTNLFNMSKRMYDFLQKWTEEFGTDVQKGYFADKEYLLKILNLCMGIGGKKRRKDFTTAKQAMEFIAYFFDETFAPTYEYRFDAATVKAVLSGFAQVYDYADDCSAWFEKVKSVAAANGFATDMKAYKADPTAFPGNVSDVAEMLRIATTGLANTPDLWTIMQILGKDRTLARLNKAMQAL